MGCSKICLGDLNTPIQIVRRQLLPPLPGQGAPRHAYAPAFAARAQAKSKAGSSLFSAVEIGGKRVTHQFTIRYTALALDTRDRVRDDTGRLYQILSVEDIDLNHRWLRLQCALAGDETVTAAR